MGGSPSRNINTIHDTDSKCHGSPDDSSWINPATTKYSQKVFINLQPEPVSSTNEKEQIKWRCYVPSTGSTFYDILLNDLGKEDSVVISSINVLNSDNPLPHKLNLIFSELVGEETSSPTNNATLMLSAQSQNHKVRTIYRCETKESFISAYAGIWMKDELKFCDSEKDFYKVETNSLLVHYYYKFGEGSKQDNQQSDVLHFPSTTTEPAFYHIKKTTADRIKNQLIQSTTKNIHYTRFKSFSIQVGFYDTTAIESILKFIKQNPQYAKPVIGIVLEVNGFKVSGCK